MDIEKLKNRVQHFANGRFDAAARVESICAAIDQLQAENAELRRKLEEARNSLPRRF